MATRSPSKMNRQYAGRKGAEARLGHQENNERRENHNRGNSHVQRQKADQAGAAARWVNNYDINEGNRFSGEGSYNQNISGSQGTSNRNFSNEGNRRNQNFGYGNQKSGRSEYVPEYQREMGRIERQGRWQDESNDEGREYSRGQQGGNFAQHQRAGHAGADARWGQNYGYSSQNYAEDEDDDDNYSNQRGSHKGNDELNDDDDENDSDNYSYSSGGSHEQHQRAGRAGAAARWGNDYNEGNQRGNNSNSQCVSYEQHQRAGQAGAASRWGNDSNEENEGYGYGYQGGNRGSNNEELGRRSGQSRRGNK